MATALKCSAQLLWRCIVEEVLSAEHNLPDVLVGYALFQVAHKGLDKAGDEVLFAEVQKRKNLVVGDRGGARIQKPDSFELTRKDTFEIILRTTNRKKASKADGVESFMTTGFS